MGIISLTVTCGLLVASHWRREATKYARWIAFTGSEWLRNRRCYLIKSLDINYFLKIQLHHCTTHFLFLLSMLMTPLSPWKLIYAACPLPKWVADGPQPSSSPSSPWASVLTFLHTVSLYSTCPHSTDNNSVPVKYSGPVPWGCVGGGSWISKWRKQVVSSTLTPTERWHVKSQHCVLFEYLKY